MLANRMITVLTVGLMLAALFAGAGGCQTVGPTNSFDRTSATLANPSPVTVDIQDNDRRSTSSGVGPSGWTTIKSDVIERFQTGATQRDLFVTKKPDGTLNLNLSSGTDVSGEGFHYENGQIKIDLAKFNTSASAPLAPSVEALNSLSDYFKSLPPEQAKVALEAVDKVTDAIKASFPTMDNAIQAIIKAATGGAVP